MKNNFDSGILRALNMPRQRSQDPKIKGPNKKGFYTMRVWIDVLKGDKPSRKKETFKLGKEKRKAVTEKARIMQTINQGQMVIQAQTTLNAMLVEFENTHVPKLGYATRLRYRSFIKTHIQPMFGSMQLCEIKTLDIQKWFDSKTLAYNSKACVRSLLSEIFSKAATWGYWKERNPVEGIDLGRKHNVREKRKISVEHTRQLLAELKPLPRIVTMVGLFTTLRISEILGLQEKHLDFEVEKILVRQRLYKGDLDRTKTDTSTRDVSMGGLAEYFRSLCTGDPEHFVFSEHRTCKDDNNLRRRHLKPAAARLGIDYPGFGFHAMRREAITAIGKHIGPQQIMKMAGHTKLDLTMLYTLTDIEEQRAGSVAYMEKIVQ